MQDQAKHPDLMLTWDEQAQGVQLHFDHKHFRSWDMVLNVLETAVRHAKDQRAMAVMNNMQMAHREKAVDKEIRRSIGL